MRFKSRATIHIIGPSGQPYGPGTSPSEFWKYFLEYSRFKPKPEDVGSDIRKYYERRIREGFPTCLKRMISDTASGAFVVIRRISYGSAIIDFDVISNVFSALGFKPEDMSLLL